MRRLTILMLCFFLTIAMRAQQDPCARYQDSPDAPHKGPRKFNVIRIAFSQATSDVLVTDPQGHRFGANPSGEGVLREIARAFYEDKDTAEFDTNLPAAQQPREITIHFAQTGAYLISFTARSDKPQWLRFSATTCGKRWKKDMIIATPQKGAVTQFTLFYDAKAKQEPQVLDGDHTEGRDPSSTSRQ